MKNKTSRFLGIGHLNPDPKWGMKAHYHNFNEIIVILGGEMRVSIAGKDLNARTGDILFYKENSAHREQSDSGSPVESIYFAWKEDALQLPPLIHDTKGRIRSMARWMYEESEPGSPQGKIIQEKLLDAILSEHKRISENREPDKLEIKIREFIRDNIKERLKLNDLADCAGMSKYHFLRKYKMLSGRTPMEEMRNIRIETAKELILTTDLPMKSVAAETGFNDEYQLCRSFRRYLNLTPGYFRRKAKSKIRSKPA
jgi:AraC-like DNA-binding protein